MTAPSALLTIALLPMTLAAATAHAQTPVYFWGLQSGCDHLESADRQAEKHLHSASQPLAMLHTPAGKPLPPCQGERCAQLLKQVCPAVSGRLLGGQVVQGKNNISFRLWLYDTQSGQIAYQDDYTQNPGLTDTFIVQAKALLEHPRFGGTPPGPKPTYCTQPLPVGGPESNGSTVSGGSVSGPLYLTVYGENKHRAELNAALEQQLQLLGRQPLPVPIESHTFSLDIMQRIVAGQQNARILGAEFKKDGKVELFLFDQKTNLTYDQNVSCPRCERDSLIAQVKQAVSDMLSHCFSDQCAQSGLPPPVEACEAFPVEQCAGLGEMLSPSMAGNAAEWLTPRTAKLIKGLTWSAFAATAATGIALIALSGTSVGNYYPPSGGVISNHLDGAAGSMLGAAGIILGISIPVTVVVDRATSHGGQKSQAGTPLAPIQCPN